MTSDETHELDLGRETLISFSSSAAMMGFGFLGVVLFARVLGPSRLGGYYFVLAIGQTVAQLSNGLGGALKKRISESGTTPEEFLSVGLIGHLGIIVAVAVGTYTLRPLVAQFTNIEHFAFGVTAVVFSLGLFQICNEVYAGLGSPGKANWADTVRSVITLVLQVVFVLSGMGAYGLILAFSTAGVLSGLGVWIVSGVVPRLPSRETIQSTTAFARWSIPSELLGNLYGRVDVILLGIVVGNEAVGFYETALRIAQPGAFFASAISGSLHVKASGLSSRNLDVLPDIKNALSYCGLFSIPLLFGAAAMPVPILRTVFGPEFIPAWGALIGLALFQVLSGYAGLFESVIGAINEVQYTFFVSLLIVIIHLPLAAILGIEYGLVGVVGATIFGESIRLFIYEVLSVRLLGELILPRQAAKQLAASGVMGGVVWFIVESLVTIRSWAWLVIVVAAGTAIYFTVLAVVSRHFRQTVENVLPMPAVYSR